jgi:hypothetical protein
VVHETIRICFTLLDNRGAGPITKPATRSISAAPSPFFHIHLRGGVQGTVQDDKHQGRQRRLPPGRYRVGDCPGKWVCNRLNPEVIISSIGHLVCESQLRAQVTTTKDWIRDRSQVLPRSGKDPLSALELPGKR